MAALGRISYGLTLLTSGKVLIVGGTDFNGDTLSTAEVFDPSTGDFAFTSGMMPAPRKNCTATLLNDGRVLVAGGVDQNDNFLDSALIYDPATDSFTPVAAHLSIPRSQHLATLLNDGMVLITGGVTTPHGGLAEPVTSAELFDPAANDFVGVGAMTTAREEHTATLLEDGRVLVAGGGTIGLTQTATAEIYDPVKRTFAATGSMAYSRTGAAAVRLADGRVLVTGGGGFAAGSAATAAVLDTAEIYDPASAQFMPTANDMPEPHFLHAIALLSDGRALLAGGFAGSGPFFFLETEAAATLFDPSTNSFTPATPLNAARAGIDAVSLADGRIFIPGGSNFQGEVLGEAEVYSAASGIFEVSGGLHGERVDHAALALPDGVILITGGINGVGEVLKTAEIYSSASGRLTLTKPMTIGHHGHTMTLLKSGKVLIAGGNNEIAELYDPVTASFTATAGRMTAVRLHATATLLNDGTVLIAGGAPDNVQPALQSAELYDPASDHFIPVAAPMRSPRVFQVAALLPDGKVLLAGGSDTDASADGATDTAEVYDPATKTFADNANPMTEQRYAATATMLKDGSVLIVDGDTQTGEIASADLYNSATGKFSATAGAPVSARVFHSATELADGTVLVAGGIGAGTGSEIYNPASGTFAPGPSMVYPRAQFTVSELNNGSVLLAGGVGDGFALPSTELFVP
jgi:hypothetical protein